MADIRITDFCEFLNAGLRIIISTEPDKNAAVNTSSHCSNDICITHSTDTGM